MSTDGVIVAVLWGLPVAAWFFFLYRCGIFRFGEYFADARRKKEMRRDEARRGVRPVHPEDVAPADRLPPDR